MADWVYHPSADDAGGADDIYFASVATHHTTTKPNTGQGVVINKGEGTGRTYFAVPMHGYPPRDFNWQNVTNIQQFVQVGPNVNDTTTDDTWYAWFPATDTVNNQVWIVTPSEVGTASITQVGSNPFNTFAEWGCTSPTGATSQAKTWNLTPYGNNLDERIKAAIDYGYMRYPLIGEHAANMASEGPFQWFFRTARVTFTYTPLSTPRVGAPLRYIGDSSTTPTEDGEFYKSTTLTTAITHPSSGFFDLYGDAFDPAIGQSISVIDDTDGSTVWTGTVESKGSTYIDFDTSLPALTYGTYWFVEAAATPSGTGTLTAAASMSGSGSAVYAGTGSITASASLSGSGSARYEGTGSPLSASVVMAGSGSLPPIVGEGTGQPLTATVALSGSGAVVAPVFSGTGALSATVAVAGSGSRVAEGTGSLTASVAMAGSGSIPVQVGNGTGTLTATVAMNGSGAAVAPSFSGTGDLSSSAVMAGSGSAVHAGSGQALTAAASLAGDGWRIGVQPGGGVEVYTDDFNRSDRVLTTDAEWYILAGRLQIESQEAALNQLSGFDAAAGWNTALGDNQYAKMTVTARGGSGINTWPGLNVRTNTADNLYLFQVRCDDTANSDSVAIYRKTGGSYTLIAGAPDIVTLSIPFTMELRAVGDQITAYIDGVEVLSVQDDTHTSGYVGIWNAAQSGSDPLANTLRVDDFEAGEVPVPLNIAWVAGILADDYAGDYNDGDPLTADPVGFGGNTWSRTGNLSFVGDIASSGKPAIATAPDSVTDSRLVTTPTYADTTKMTAVIVARAVSASGCDFIDGDAAGNRRLVDYTGSAWRMYAGSTVVQGGTSDTDLHLFIAYFDTVANETLEVDGVEVINGEAGSQANGQLWIGSSSNGGHYGSEVAFVGFIDRALTTQEKDDLWAWYQAEYLGIGGGAWPDIAATVTMAGLGEVGAPTYSGTGSLAASVSMAGSGSAVYAGSGDLTSTAALAGAGATVREGSGTLDATVAMAGSGAVVAPSFSGNGALAASVAMTGTGFAVGGEGSGSGFLSATVALSGQGSAVHSGSGSVSATVALSSTGTTSRGGTGVLAASGALLGAGLRVAVGGGSVAVTVALSGAGSSQSGGTGQPLTATVALSGTGSAVHAGTGQLDVTALLAGSGQPVAPVFSGTGALLAAAVLAGQGLTVRIGSGALTGSVSLTGAGRDPAATRVEIWNGSEWSGAEAWNGSAWVQAEVWNDIDGVWVPIAGI